MLLRSMQNTQELADAKAENDALRDDVAAGRRQFAYQQSVSQCVKPPPPAWIIRPPQTQRNTAERDYFTLKRGPICYLCKNNWKEPRSILMGSADKLPIDGQLVQLFSTTTTRFQRSINA